MRRFHLVFAVALGMLTLASALPHMTPLMSAQIPSGQMKSVSSGSGPYKVLKVAKVGGDGGFEQAECGRGACRCRSQPMTEQEVADAHRDETEVACDEDASGAGKEC